MHVHLYISHVPNCVPLPPFRCPDCPSRDSHMFFLLLWSSLASAMHYFLSGACPISNARVRATAPQPPLLACACVRVCMCVGGGVSRLPQLHLKDGLNQTLESIPSKEAGGMFKSARRYRQGYGKVRRRRDAAGSRVKERGGEIKEFK